jgi:hypothetical protein
VDSLKTVPSTEVLLPLERAVACPSETRSGTSCSSEPVDWHHAFRVLCAALGKQWVSSDVLVLAGLEMKRAGVSDEVLEEYVLHLGANRTRGVHNFMG